MKKVGKEHVRSWLQQRWREWVPLPSLEQVRIELGWNSTVQTVADAPTRPRASRAVPDK